MLRVLYIADVNMFANNGGGLCNLSCYNAVCKIFPENVDLMHAEEYIPLNYNNINIIPVPRMSNLHRGFNLIRGRIHRLNPFAIKYITKNYTKYSLCIINGGITAGDMIDKIKSLGLKTVVIHHNFETDYQIFNKTLMSFYGLMPYYIIRNEKKAFLKADINYFLTSYDKIKFYESYGLPLGLCDIIGCFETCDKQMDLNNFYSEPKTIVISGSLNFRQTTDGIIDFFKNYYSDAINLDPNIKVLITGRNPVKAILELKNEFDNIEICINPENINSIVQRGCIYLCPISAGGGIKLRIMDGLRLGLPILTHEKSVRGYESFLNKKYFKTYKDLDTFKKSFKDLMNLIEMKKNDNFQIQQDYLDTYSFNAGVKRFEKLLNQYKK